jgi:hypothetical protein
MNAHAYDPGISDLRELALAVVRPEPGAAVMSARSAARCLSGVMNLVGRKYSTAIMQRACSLLVRHDPAWITSFGLLPTPGFVPGADKVSEVIEMIAVVARGILPIAGAENMRAALSFWACETDPAIWTSIVSG